MRLSRSVESVSPSLAYLLPCKLSQVNKKERQCCEMGTLRRVISEMGEWE